ncbi:olfactory receptor 5G9-like [Dendropsophus ebraccatus]|uniref:olfactory receptor 5G9-like n=1 Tax=Dendropsophus ebraccatus TaxID=150705 RepID=UPI003831F3B4
MGNQDPDPIPIGPSRETQTSNQTKTHKERGGENCPSKHKYKLGKRQKPVTPSPPQPVTPSPLQHVTHSPPQPVTSLPPQPVNPLLLQPVTPSFLLPVTPSPPQPVTSLPPQPVTPSPRKPVTPSPLQPVTSLPPQPVTPSPRKPVTPSPPQPVTPSPPQPVTPSPLQHVTHSPPQPVTSLPPQPTNLTRVTEFFLFGFQGSQLIRNVLFLLFLLVYGTTICGNLLIITLVSTSKILHTPMYFFISQLSITDILLSTVIVPNLLHILLNNGATITFIGCMTQFFFFGGSEAFECFLLAVMSYDRYVAICNPLRYSTIVTNTFCGKLVAVCWLWGFGISFIFTITPAKLIFCGPNSIDHVFCDIVPLLKLSCSDTFIVFMEIYVISIPIVFIPTTIIVVSYTYIVSTIMGIPSSTGRQKAFSTCSSHLIVVSIFYGTMFGVYVVPTKGRTLTMSKVLSLLYTVFTPFINPIIYSLRNKDIKKAVGGTLGKHRVLLTVSTVTCDLPRM